MSFTIPSCPPSVNSNYNIIFSLKRVEMKPECRLWQSKAITYMPTFKPIQTLPGLLRAEVTFYYPMYSKEGKLKKKDASNMLKLLIDAISNRYGIDDKFVTEGSFKAVDSEQEKTEVILSVL